MAPGRLDAEAATKRIAGVVGVANDIEVRVPEVDARPDPEIARDAVAALQKELPAWAQRLKVLVTKGWVTLEGELEWNYQRDIAETAIRRIRGVRNVTNKIALKPTVVASDIKRRIEEAFERSAQIDASGVMVEANGSEVILKGRVRTWAERQEAERAAWAAAGVTKVDNQIKITG